MDPIKAIINPAKARESSTSRDKRTGSCISSTASNNFSELTFFWYAWASLIAVFKAKDSKIIATDSTAICHGKYSGWNSWSLGCNIISIPSKRAKPPETPKIKTATTKAQKNWTFL